MHPAVPHGHWQPSSCSHYHFLVALGRPGSDTKAISTDKYIRFQCSCALFWRSQWCACHHALMLGAYLKKASVGFEAKSVTHKRIPCRIGLGKLGKECTKEYWRPLAKPATAPKLCTTA